MTTRYQKSQIEDVARILHDAWGEARDVGGLAERYMDDTTVSNLTHDFADLFAADNPPTCLHCGQEAIELGDTCLVGGGIGAPHAHTQGFDPEQFLVACGLKSEG
ncbi:hypothetical protein LCGC14_2941870 [marine sediment metagenome]|uniref:Uncharacterized protein n=1 Tax=marine sediment metagenome TaxID=412755 RepID=A0A0F8XHP9_9ZZZZ